MDRFALSSVLLVMAVAGCPGPSGLKPLPEGPPPEYEKPRVYDPEGKNIDGQPPALSTDDVPDEPPPPAAPGPALPEDDAPPEPPEDAPPADAPPADAPPADAPPAGAPPAGALPAPAEEPAPEPQP